MALAFSQLVQQIAPARLESGLELLSDRILYLLFQQPSSKAELAKSLGEQS